MVLVFKKGSADRFINNCACWIYTVHQLAEDCVFVSCWKARKVLLNSTLFNAMPND